VEAKRTQPVKPNDSAKLSNRECTRSRRGQGQLGLDASGERRRSVRSTHTGRQSVYVAQTLGSDGFFGDLFVRLEPPPRAARSRAPSLAPQNPEFSEKT